MPTATPTSTLAAYPLRYQLLRFLLPMATVGRVTEGGVVGGGLAPMGGFGATGDPIQIESRFVEG